MKLLNIIDVTYDFYKKPSMYLAFPNCSMKCNIDSSSDVCNNTCLIKSDIIQIDGDKLIERYLSNSESKAIVFSGFEPFDSKFDMIPFIDALRNKYLCDDDIVIYTGYTEDELSGKAIFSYEGVDNRILVDMFNQLISYNNIIVKFGRYIKGDEDHIDPILGVTLHSNNQYAKMI